MNVEVTLLGTGTSVGLPVIGCHCAVCTSGDPRDQRLRTSAHVVVRTDHGAVHLQIDAGPDFRQQALTNGIETVDAVLITHEHFDHVVGLDDLRPFFFRDQTPIPVLAPPRAAQMLEEMFSYIFRDGTYPGVSRLALHPTSGATTVMSRTTPEAAIEVLPVPLLHGDLPIVGWRIGPLAYLTDVSAIPEDSFALLEGVDVLVLDGLRPDPHPTHLSFGEAADIAARVGARQTWLVHMTHDMLHAEADAMLPSGVRLGYDGLRFVARG